MSAVALVTILGVAVTIEATGGFPSQLAHLYYLPVVLGALALSPRYSLAVAIVAALLVSPAVDVLHALANRPDYFAQSSPWNLSPSGWILRPIAFIAISLVGSRLSQERIEKVEEHLRREAREEELKALSRIDKMILSGAGEIQSIEEIARFVLELTHAKQAGVVIPSPTGRREQTYLGHRRLPNGDTIPYVAEHRTYGEGVAGWVMVHGGTAATSDILTDARYARLAEIAQEAGFRSSAAAAVVLDGEMLGALVIHYEDPRDFSKEELHALERIADQAAVAVANARQREALTNMGLETAMVLSNVIETRDAYTGDHCRRLVDFAGLTGQSLHLSGKEIELIKLGAALHDVGKIAVPDSILMKREKLTPDEYAQIKQHCYFGGQICKKVPFLRSVHDIVYHHHEFYDGRGYPDGIAGDRIPLGSRIVAVVDAYDAITSDRPYRVALSQDDAIEILQKGSGTQWDPEIVSCFLDGIKGDFDRLRAA
ncbi:MAG TPA: HD domain-containing phosphohydrolase [Dehalococcoidia bacterium]|jgi:HD-GYP domain-containing protein (c-di-GMP phosphodiesterase class II)|nr:HD domain-containing phosphohydrolase [Dehalococcoidia bacterium]